MNWRHAKAKAPLFELMPGLTERSVFVYKEVKDTIQIRHTYMQTTIDKVDIDKYLSPILNDGEYDEVTPELSTYLDEAFKKNLKK